MDWVGLDRIGLDWIGLVVRAMAMVWLVRARTRMMVLTKTLLFSLILRVVNLLRLE